MLFFSHCWKGCWQLFFSLDVSVPLLGVTKSINLIKVWLPFCSHCALVCSHLTYSDKYNQFFVRESYSHNKQYFKIRCSIFIVLYPYFKRWWRLYFHKLSPILFPPDPLFFPLQWVQEKYFYGNKYFKIITTNLSDNTSRQSSSVHLLYALQKNHDNFVNQTSWVLLCKWEILEWFCNGVGRELLRGASYLSVWQWERGNKPNKHYKEFTTDDWLPHMKLENSFMNTGKGALIIIWRNL